MQALLDLYTIRRELGRLDNFKIAMIGDLLNGRTVHSLAYLLSKFDNVEMVFVSPDILKLKPDLKEYLTDSGVKWREETSLDAAVGEVDVLYQTRIQEERFLVWAHCLWSIFCCSSEIKNVLWVRGTESNRMHIMSANTVACYVFCASCYRRQSEER